MVMCSYCKDLVFCRSLIEAQEIFGLNFDMSEFDQIARDGIDSEDDDEDDPEAGKVGVVNGCGRTVIESHTLYVSLPGITVAFYYSLKNI